MADAITSADAPVSGRTERGGAPSQRPPHYDEVAGLRPLIDLEEFANAGFQSEVSLALVGHGVRAGAAFYQECAGLRQPAADSAINLADLSVGLVSPLLPLARAACSHRVLGMRPTNAQSTNWSRDQFTQDGSRQARATRVGRRTSRLRTGCAPGT